MISRKIRQFLNSPLPFFVSHAVPSPFDITIILFSIMGNKDKDKLLT